MVEIGAAQITVPADTVRGVAISAPVEVFVRPEQLRLCEPGDPCGSSGKVVAQVYQGAHIDLYIECVDSSSGRLLARLAASEGTKWPVGVQVGISIGSGAATAFAAT
jgi:hypothetical protein